MQMCQAHWTALREAIADKGLEPFVAKDGKAATDAAVRQLNGESDDADFDPLMDANWAIIGQYIHDVGLVAMVGDLCPLCEVEKNRKGLAQDWIDGSTDDQLMYARSIGLVPQEQ